MHGVKSVVHVLVELTGAAKSVELVKRSKIVKIFFTALDEVNWHVVRLELLTGKWVKGVVDVCL